MAAAATRDDKHGAPGLAVFGGAFNPPHRTHRRLVAAALAQLPIRELLVIPAGDHPHKRSGDLAAGEHRLAMCRLAFAGMEGVVVDDRELRRRGPSFTVDTLAELATEHPGHQLWFLIGADNVRSLPTWHDHHRLLRLAKIATFARQGYGLDSAALVGLDLDGEEQHALLAHPIRFAMDAIAARDLRRRLATGERKIDELDPAVLHYVLDHHLYGT